MVLFWGADIRLSELFFGLWRAYTLLSSAYALL
jgi:hypothetical protein